jgi:hypothetical protein
VFRDSLKTGLKSTQKGKFIMGKFSIWGWPLVIVVALIVHAPARALAVAAPGTTATGTCAVLDNTCAATDATFVPTSIKLSVSGSGVVSLTCLGTTTAKPTKTTKCDGEKLGGANGETAPTQPCAMTLGVNAVSTDDWTETITKSGNVTLKCTAGGKDKK